MLTIYHQTNLSQSEIELFKWYSNKLLWSQIVGLPEPLNTQNYFPRTNYTKILSEIYNSKNTFYIFKYHDNRYDFKYYKQLGWADYFFDKYWQPDQNKYTVKLEGVKCTNETHDPELFSWNEAADMCSQMFNGHLPEFISRNEQEEFLSIIKRSDLYPTEAVYINLQKKKHDKVSKPDFCSIIYM